MRPALSSQVRWVARTDRTVPDASQRTYRGRTLPHAVTTAVAHLDAAGDTVTALEAALHAKSTRHEARARTLAGLTTRAEADVQSLA